MLPWERAGCSPLRGRPASTPGALSHARRRPGPVAAVCGPDEPARNCFMPARVEDGEVSPERRDGGRRQLVQQVVTRGGGHEDCGGAHGVHRSPGTGPRSPRTASVLLPPEGREEGAAARPPGSSAGNGTRPRRARTRPRGVAECGVGTEMSRSRPEGSAPESNHGRRPRRDRARRTRRSQPRPAAARAAVVDGRCPAGGRRPRRLPPGGHRRGRCFLEGCVSHWGSPARARPLREDGVGEGGRPWTVQVRAAGAARTGSRKCSTSGMGSASRSPGAPRPRRN